MGTDTKTRMNPNMFPEILGNTKHMQKTGLDARQLEIWTQANRQQEMIEIVLSIPPKACDPV